MVAAVALAVALVEPSGLDLLLGNLERYTAPVTAGHGYLDVLRRLASRGDVLTFRSRPAFVLAAGASLAAWIGAAVLAAYRRSRLAVADLAAFVGGGAGIAIWIAMLQSHTFIHAGFMTRLLMVPIALGYAALCWQVRELAALRSTSAVAP